MSTANPRVSVVIIVRDAPEAEQTLDLLRAQVVANDAECLVIDASDGRMAAVAVLHPWLRWITYPAPLDGAISIAGQRNVGIREARADVIAFIDAGCKPVEGWLATLTAPIIAGDALLTCGPIRSQRPGVYTIVNDHPDRALVTPVPTGNLALNRSLIAQIGGFDTRFAYGSDTDWTLRAAEAGVRACVIRSAEVILDFGPVETSVRRSFRYGRGRTRMLRLHPSRLVGQLRRQPDYAIYPLYLLGALPALAAGLIVSPLVPLAYVALLAVPLLRHRTHPAPFAVLIDHLVQGTGLLTELAGALFPTSPTILHFPFDPGPYQEPLNRELGVIGVRSGVLRGLTPFQSLNVALLPLSLLAARLRSGRIWQIHWMWGFLPGARVPRLVRWLCRIYFGALLAFARRIGFRLVWTAHNLLPHRPVFDDDGAARRTLLAAVDAVVVHHPKTAADLADRFGKLPPVVAAPQGGAELPLLPARDAARRELTLPTDRLALVFTGRILPYKGLLELFAALTQLSPNERSRIALRIAGEPEPVSHRDELTAAASPLRDLDLAIEWERISDARYATYLAAADLALFPFRSITNSGSVITALSAGTPVLIAGHPTLAALPEPAVLRYAPNDGLDALIGALRVALARTSTEWAEARAAAASFATTATWATAAEVHRELYRKLLGGGQ